ncbi:MAG: AAA family ATPase, partial [Myxococcales bacterium]|nr:AAA family ATPase [Myxococcales bacterium]
SEARCATVRREMAPTGSDHELSPKQLATRCDPRSLGFQLSTELDGRRPVIGQERAVEALNFGLTVSRAGFNVFVLGPTGSGRARLSRALVATHAAKEPVPEDCCYVHNFDDPRKPRALLLPPGQASRLRDHMDRVSEELMVAIPAARESRRFRESADSIEQEINRRHEALLDEIVEQARKLDVAVLRNPTGFMLAPMRDGEVLDPDQQKTLTKEEKERLAENAEKVQQRIHDALKRVPQLQREQRERTRALERDLVAATTAEILSECRRAFKGLEAIEAYLDDVERDIVRHAPQLLQAHAQQESAPPATIDNSLFRESPILRRYRINVMVDHRNTEGAPIEVVDHPSSGNLVGKVEHLSQLGVLVTDFNLIKPGAFHRARGGYLVIDARRLLTQPVSYEQLKRVLRSGEIRIESVAEALDLTHTVTLTPEPVPFTGKVILIGEPWLYHRLSMLDPEFEELFKVAAEFEGTMKRSPETSRAYAGLLARVAHNEGLRPLQAGAVARVIDHAARMSGDAKKLSMHVREVFDLLAEADHLASLAERDTVTKVDVEEAIAFRRRRGGRIRENVQELLTNKTIGVETVGKQVGQINALAVVPVPQAPFGHPTRVTARVRLGRGEIVAIDREVAMGGPIHNKGVLILEGLLGSRYLPDRPSSLRATLVFEQSYGVIEGDSASLAELLALLSAIGELPVRQGCAVTGSIDQLGNVQAVGGVNEKIEGFFDLCNARGLDGDQGVIIPAINAGNLMLDQRVIDAVRKGRFHVWGINTLDEALAVVTGMAAGKRASNGRYPDRSANGRIEARLAALQRSARQASKPKAEAQDASLKPQVSKKKVSKKKVSKKKVSKKKVNRKKVRGS